MDVYLSHIKYALGTMTSIDKLNETAASDVDVDIFKNLGFGTVCVSNQSTYGLAENCIERSLQSAAINGSEISGLIYTSINLLYQPFRILEFEAMCKKLGLINTQLIGLYLSGCANLTTAIQVASNLIRAGTHKRVLIVASDKMDSNRVFHPNLAVTSDGAACCVISTKPEGYKIIQSVHETNLQLAAVPEATLGLEQIQQRVVWGKKVWRKFMGKLCENDKSITQVICNNFSLPVLQSYAFQSGIEIQKYYTKNIKRIGHIPYAETLINLSDYTGSVNEDSVKNVILFNASIKNMGLTLLTRSERALSVCI